MKAAKILGGFRTDKVDKFGKLTIRYDGKLRHLGMGVAYRGHKI